VFAATTVACQPTKGAATQPDPTAVSTGASLNTEVSVLRANGQEIYRTQQDTLGAFLAEIDLVLGPGERLLADGRPVAIAALGTEPLPAQIVIDAYKTVTLNVDGAARPLRTTAATVSEALAAAGIAIGAADTVTPPLDVVLAPEMTITIQRARPYRIVVDGQTIEADSDATVVAAIVDDAGLTLGELDRTQPALDATLRPGDMIHIIRVTERFETADTPIPFETVYLPDDTLPLDQVVYATAGTPGILRRQTRIVEENGVAISREAAGEWVEQEPVNEAYRYGTQITVQTMDTPNGPIEYWRVVNMRVASYTPSSAGKKPGEKGYGITASGVPAGQGVVAVDPSVVPFRSNVYVPGYGVAMAGDTGGGVKGRFIDLGYSDDDYQHWHGTVDVYFLTPVPPPDKIRYILP
jgi:3D (Asp-Asp-Asp) domain-containing protein